MASCLTRPGDLLGITFGTLSGFTFGLTYILTTSVAFLSGIRSSKLPGIYSHMLCGKYLSLNLAFFMAYRLHCVQRQTSKCPGCPLSPQAWYMVEVGQCPLRTKLRWCLEVAEETEDKEEAEAPSIKSNNPHLTKQNANPKAIMTQARSAMEFTPSRPRT